MKTTIKTVLAAILVITSVQAQATELPPRNPWLADSIYAMGHGDSAQQDAVTVAGPSGPGRQLTAAEIQYQHTGPGHFGAAISSAYADGRRVMWSNGLDRISKIDHDSFEVLAEYVFPDVETYGEAQADAAYAYFDASNDGFFAFTKAFREVLKLRNLSGVYTLLDKDNRYYIGNKDGRITVYGDAEEGNPDSAIRVLNEFQIPAQATGLLVGMNMTFDGWLIVATEHGWVIAIRQDLSEHRLVRMQHSAGAEDKATARTGHGWVRNGFAIDKDGGIYIASQAHMHKVVWTGDELSTREADGAWTAPYANSWGHGTGATPSLMGFGEEDRFVVITDGEPRMNLLLYWRDAIPEGWQAPPGAPDQRVAGLLPVTMGDESLREIQSEQSVVVAGHDALVVNNMPRNVPWYVPEALQSLYISYLGSNPRHQPYGVQKFRWNNETRQLEVAWVNRAISSPSCVPIISYASQAVYLIGARDRQWTLEALDLASGESLFHHRIGGERYNVLYAGTLLDEAGRIHYGTPYGRVRLNPELGK